MIDGIVTAQMKWLEEENYDTVLNYSLNGGTPTGYIHIWSPKAANFAIDNLKLDNLDENPNVIETEYRSGNIEIPTSVQPKQQERIYAKTEEKGCTWYWLIPITAAAGAFALAVTALIVCGRDKRKEAARDGK